MILYIYIASSYTMVFIDTEKYHWLLEITMDNP
jgi:hypothetical protein